MRDNILILGASSFVGKILSEQLNEQKIYCTHNKNPIKNGIKFDITRDHISELPVDFNSISHAIILLGDTEPNSCFFDINYSNNLNITSIIRIIDFLKKYQIKIIFFSTEFVYDGKKGDYSEIDLPNPILEYGRQKLVIETYLHNYEYSTILRLAKVYGSHFNDGTLFSEWANKINNNEIIVCANDQYFSPIFVNDVIKITKEAIYKNIFGLFNLSCGRRYSRLELLRLLLAYKFPEKSVSILEKSIDAFNLPEKRPKDVSMISLKAEKIFGVKFIIPEDFLKYHLSLAS